MNGVVFVLRRRPAAPPAGVAEYLQTVDFIRRKGRNDAVERHKFLHRAVPKNAGEGLIGEQQFPIPVHEDALNGAADQVAVAFLEFIERLFGAFSAGLVPFGLQQMRFHGFQFGYQFFLGPAKAVFSGLFVIGHEQAFL